MKRHICLLTAFVLLVFLLSVSTILSCAEEDDEDRDDDDDDDDDDEAPGSYIVTSDYGPQRYHIINGDTYVEYDAVTAQGDLSLTGLWDATLVPDLTGDLKSVFVSVPEGYGNGQLFNADPFTGENAAKMTDIDRPGMGSIVPAGLRGILFIAVDEAGTLPEIKEMQLIDTSPGTFKDEGFQKNIAGDLCSSWVGGFQSVSYAPSGAAIGVGWHCKHLETGSDTKEYTTVLAFDPEQGDCGDPVFEREGAHSVADTCLAPDGSRIFWSVGLPNVSKEVFSAPPGEPDKVIELTDSFMGGDFNNFDCAPEGSRFVLNNNEVKPDLFVIEYDEISDDTLVFDEPVQITDTTTSQDGYRRPRWVKSQ